MKEQFGKFMKKLRIDNEETLAEMALKLGVSTGYLSQMENLKRKVTQDLINNMEKVYYPSMSKSKINEFEEILKHLVSEVTVNVEETTEQKKKLGIEFAKSFEYLSDEDSAEIYKILKKKNK